MMLRVLFILGIVFSLSIDAAEQSNDANNKLSSAVNTQKKVPSSLSLSTIEITGVDNALKQNIELHMPVTTPRCDAERAKVKLFFTTVKKHLRKASRALGYYDADFRSGGKIINNCWKLRIKVTPGQPTKISSQLIKVIGEGKTEKKFKQILTKLPYKKGDLFNHQLYTDFKTSLSEAAQSLGYFNADFIKHEIKVNPSTHQAQIVLIYNTHKRFRYGKITIKQNVLSDKGIKKYLLIAENQFYKTEDLIKQQQQLQQSGYYQLIKIDTQLANTKNNTVPIDITLKAKKRNAYKFKVGYGSDTGGRTSIEMDRRWTGDSGKKLKASAQLAQNLSGISLQLINPRTNPEDNSLIFNSDWKIDKNDDITSQNINIGGKSLWKNSNDWIQSVSLAALLDKTQVEGNPQVNSKLLLFGLGLEKTKADNLIYPNNGWKLSYSFKAAGNDLLSDQNFMQFQTIAKKIISINNSRFLGRLQLGTTKVEDFDRLPKSLRFFAGGGNSVRGYNYESLGEKNSTGKIIGGKHLLNLSLEYQYPITDDWKAALFVDAGNAFNDWKHYKIHVGVGFGARWKSPIGPVRIDLGFPKDNYKQPTLHLSVGSEL